MYKRQVETTARKKRLVPGGQPGAGGRIAQQHSRAAANHSSGRACSAEQGPAVAWRACTPRAEHRRRTRAGDGPRHTQCWVVDTGASRNICPPSAAAGQLRPSDAIVETANGTVRAMGEATVAVPGLGATVKAIVLPGSPRLLSAGELVEAGCALRWDAGSCALTPPCGHDVVLQVVGGIPTLPAHGCACARRGCREDAGGRVAQAAVSYTHLTLPTKA